MCSKNPKKTYPESHMSMVEKIKRAQKESYNFLLDYCLEIDPQNSEKTYLEYGSDFEKNSEKVSQEIENFKTRVASIPLLAVILLWAKNVSSDKVFGARHIMMMQDLIENHLLLCNQPVDGKLLTISEFSGLGHQTNIDRIRCFKEWSVDKREDYVSFYVEFSSWFSSVSFGLVAKAIDHDRASTANRSLPFDIYINILKELADREKILAKIFYLGGTRSLEEVLSLEIQDVDYKNGILRISEEAIRYPKHLFEDIREYIGTRKRGFVFVGRQGDRIDHTVPYRALKTKIMKLKLDPSFTFKDFVKNV